MTYDFAKLGEELKAQGLELAEEQVKAALATILKWAKEEAAKTAMPFDDLAVEAIEKFGKPSLDVIVDKIDGQVG